MEKPLFLYENSFLNLSIDSQEVMISSFPNKLVIGVPFLRGYNKTQSLYFCIHEFKDFFYTLCSAIEYITFAANDNGGVILRREDEEVYEWEGVELNHSKPQGETQQERKFKLKKLEKNILKFEILLSFHQTETLIKIINELILSSMCLKFEDRKLIEKFVKNKLCPNFDDKDELARVLLKEKETDDVASRVDLMFYYKDILQLLVESNDLRIKLIHPQFFIDTLSSSNS